MNSLWAVTETPIFAEQRARLVKEEIRNITDATMLSLLAEGTAETHRDWSDVATDVLEVSMVGEDERQHIFDWMDRMTLSEEKPDLSGLRSNEDDLEASLPSEMSLQVPLNELLTPLNGILAFSAVTMEESDILKIRRSLGIIYKTAGLTHHLVGDIARFADHPASVAGSEEEIIGNADSY